MTDYQKRLIEALRACDEKGEGCDKCPCAYYELCRDVLSCNAADELERMIEAVDKTVASSAEIQSLEKRLNELEQIRSERDAAIADLKEIPDCLVCKFRSNSYESEPCKSCYYPPKGEGSFRYWIWRGVCDENEPSVKPKS